MDEEELAADRCAEWKRRLDELAARSVQAASRHQYYGMRALASYRANDPRRPTVCLVHGINSSSGGFVHVIPLLEQAGYGVVVFDYPVQPAARRFLRPVSPRLDCVSHKAAGENQPWAILAHSMGALVARSYVEAEGRTDRDVASMILIAPVNQGAMSPGSSRSTRRSRACLRSTASGLPRLWPSFPTASARLPTTCCPDSAFLSGSTAARGPAMFPTTSWRGTAESFPATSASRRRPARQPDPGKTACSASSPVWPVGRSSPLLDELTDGSGDGCVAVERTRLEGADDHVTIHANHAELIRAPLLYPDDGPVPCMPYVLRWLQADLRPRPADPAPFESHSIP